MRIRLFVLPFVLACAALSPAQTVSTWILGRGLHVRLPGDPSAGGVPWAQGSLGLPTSWSAEGDGVRVEIAEGLRASGEQEVLDQMGKALPGAASVQKFSVSSYPAYLGTAGGAKVLAIQTPRRTWVALAKGADAVSLAVLRSITVERDEAQNWHRRYMPGVGLRTFLPFHLATDLSAPQGDNRKDYELKFDGFDFNASVQTVEPGKRLDLKKTMDEDVKDHKADKRYTDLKVKRIRIKEVQDAEIAVYDYKEGGSKPKTQYFLVGRGNNGAGLMIRWTYDSTNPLHVDYGNRLLFGLEQPKVDNRGATVTWSSPEDGFSVEVPKQLSQTKSGSDVREWVGDTPAMVITTRVADNSGGQVNAKAVTDLMDSVFKGTSGVTSYSSTATPFVVSGIEGMLLKAKLKMGSVNAYRYGLVVQTLFRTYVVDVLASEEDAAERIVESARIDLNVTDKRFTRTSIKGSAFSTLSTEFTKSLDLPSDAIYDSVQGLQLAFDDKLTLTQIAQHAKEGIVQPNNVAKDVVKEMAKATKGKTTILNEGWGMDGSLLSYWIVYELEISGKKLHCMCYVTVKGRDSLVQSMLQMIPDSTATGVSQILMNSFRA